MFNPFNVCIVSKSTGRIYRKENIDDINYYDDTITLFELKNKVGNNNHFKIGNVYLNEDEQKYYIFTLIKNKDYTGYKCISGFGFLVFDVGSEDIKRCQLIHGVDFIKNKELDYISNIFVDKDYVSSVLDCNFFKEYFDYLYKINELTFYYEGRKQRVFSTLEKIKGDSIFFSENLIQRDFSFSIYYHQRNFLEKKYNSFFIKNGSLFTLREESKKLLSNKHELRSEILYNNFVDLDTISDKVFSNILTFFNKFFIYLDDSGSVKVHSLNKELENDEIDYTLYLKITGKNFLILPEEEILINVLELVND